MVTIGFMGAKNLSDKYEPPTFGQLLMNQSEMRFSTYIFF